MNPSGDAAGGARPFPLTRRTLIEDLRDAAPEVRERAFADLCGAYWKPVYAYLRNQGRRSPEETEDLVQSFFARALEKNFFMSFDPARGRFRTFLRTCLDAFAQNDLRARLAQKRDERRTAPIAGPDGETAEIADPRVSENPGAAFDVEWKRQIIAGALADLEAACTAGGRTRDYVLFSRYDLHAGDGARPTYAEIGAEFGIDAVAVTNRLHAARRDLRRFVLERIRRVTANEDEFREEVRSVLGIDP